MILWMHTQVKSQGSWPAAVVEFPCSSAPVDYNYLLQTKYTL